ncbi:MAG TPA: ATP-binding protein [Caulobacteraceae bacterium]|jgi:PAS domain S-box-containing protein|nr:ATP-binding protein [Caulobacteraceae bacterium]
MIGLGAAVLLLAVGSLAFAREVGQIAAVWPVNALVVAVLLRSPRSSWPRWLAAAVIGIAAANVTATDNVLWAMVVMGCNGFEIILCAGLMRRFAGSDIDLTRQKQLLLFWLIACVSPIVSAIVAALLVAPDDIGAASTNLTARWARDALGLLIVTPALLALTPDSLRALARRLRSGRGWMSICVLALSLALVFGQSNYPFLFLIPPALILVAFELGVVGSAIALLVTAFVAVVVTLSGSGPAMLVHSGLSGRLAVLQILLVTLTVSVLPVAAALARRERLEADLREANRLSSLAQQIAGIGHWRTEVVTGERIWSDQVYEMHGIRRLGDPTPWLRAIALYSSEDQARVRAALALTVASGAPFDLKVRLRRADDGRERVVVFKGEVERDQAGKARAVFGVMRDITDEDTALHRIAESEARYRAIAESATDIISRTGLDGRLTYISPSITQVTGYDAAALVGQSMLAFVHPDDVEPLRAAYRRSLADPHGDNSPARYRCRRADGSWVSLECNPTLLRDADGAPQEFVEVTRNVGAQVDLERELTAARDAAEAATAAKSDFLANMSHEIRTPLTSILGFTSLLADRSDLDSAARTHVERIARAGKSLLSIVNDILDFSKLEAGHFEISPTPASPAEVLRDALLMFTPQAEAKGLSLVFEGADELPPYVMIDADRLRQILHNLIGNAIKFTDSGSVSLIGLYEPDGARLVVRVRDTGAGLSQDQQEKLFQRFSQVDASTTRRHGGTGLGLAICKGLAEAMGGDIGVTSEAGQGSVFQVSVSAPTASFPRRAEPSEEMASIDGLRLLVVDDNPFNRELVRAVLAPLGVEVTDAAGGESAIEAAKAAPFDVILMDIRMPDLDGPAAAARIRAEDGPNQRIPILAFSADVDMSAHEADASDFDGVVRKPITPLDLIAALSRCFDWRDGQIAESDVAAA